MNEPLYDPVLYQSDMWRRAYAERLALYQPDQYRDALKLQADVTYEEYRENARQQEARDRGAFTGEMPKPIDPYDWIEGGYLMPAAVRWPL